jgi:hypothetical protein
MTQADFWAYFPLGLADRPPHGAQGPRGLLRPDEPARLRDPGLSQRSLREVYVASGWKALRVGGGLILVAAGLLGVILPIIPGVPLLLAGVAILGVDHPVLRPVTATLRRWGIIKSRHARQEQ